MSPETATLLFSITFGAVAPLSPAPAIVNAALRSPATYLPVERAVTNWRFQAARRLALTPAEALGLLAGHDPRGLGRCVRLNNYWCIKGVGWNGMVAADSEGHVAFTSAVEGAAVATLLLRRYYLEFERRSASAIVSRWAPPQCGAPVGSIARSPGRLGLAQRRANLGPEPKPRAILAVRGIGATLRAHYLAVRRLGRKAGGGLRRSVVPDHAPSLIRAPTIAAGFGEPRLALPSLSLGALLGPIPVPSGGASPSISSCALDGQRLRNYAARAIEGIGSSPDADLDLFEPDGTPKPVLARLMENMANVEIGPLKVDPSVIQAGIARATTAMRAARAALATSKPEAAAP